MNKDCIFCYDNCESRIIIENCDMFAIYDGYPVTKGHILIIPKRHTPDYFSLSGDEILDMNNLIYLCREDILSKDQSITGYNIGMNCGESAGQTIFHCHIHLIPRRDGDTPNPRGGVRGVIPDKMSY